MNSYILLEDIKNIIKVKKLAYLVLLKVDEDRPSSKVRLFINNQLKKLESIRNQLRFANASDNSKTNLRRLGRINNYIRKNF